MGFGNEREFIDYQQAKEKESKAMRCPLLMLGNLAGQDSHTDATNNCIKEECAWWHKGLEECKFALLEDEIATIMGTLLHLSVDLDKSGKLPHWQPTGKKEGEL